jgi:hypothetical protein
LSVHHHWRCRLRGGGHALRRRRNSVPGFPCLASVIAIAGVQPRILGITGGYRARMHFRLMDRPTYVVGESTDDDPAPTPEADHVERPDTGSVCDALPLDSNVHSSRLYSCGWLE